MGKAQTNATSAYDKYINYKAFAVAVGTFTLLLLLPMPASIYDVGTERALGTESVRAHLAVEMFNRQYEEAEQWEALAVDVVEANMLQGASSKKALLRRDRAGLTKLGIDALPAHYAKTRAYFEGLDESRAAALLKGAKRFRTEQLDYDKLDPEQRAKADRAAWHIQVCLAMVAFVVICFLTEAIPLPGVAFCIGLILVFTGIVGREEVASLFWSDACWFIMGSLMFAAAFVKTGVDKRICLAIFRVLARPRIKWITLVLIAVIAPAAGFISDHALAAMFLPIAMILYSNSLTEEHPSDPELAKMLMICIAMACNIGGFGSPSGGARNVIVMTYLEDMFGISTGYGQWIVFGLPFVLIMIPILWLALNWRFKPKIQDLGPALASLRADIRRSGGWTRNQIVAVGIFALMLLGWITENNLLHSLIGIRLGIGVIAVAGAVAYLLTGVVNWRDYQQKVDWGVVWLYAGAIIFGKTLDQTGTAYWMASSVVEGMAALGLDSGESLLAVGSLVTAGLTNLMADGPAAAAVAPVTLNMAAIAGPGTVLVPFMGLATACASSFAYLLIIGTPPNAIVYASGYLQARDFLRVGFICLGAAFGVLMLLAFVVWPLIGFGDLQPM